MNPISIFPPPTRALSRHNTRSAGNSSSASGNALARSQTHSASAAAHPSSSSTAAGHDAQDGQASPSGNSAGTNHGRNRSFGSAVGSASTIWTPFTSTTNNKDNNESSSGPNSASSHSNSHHPVSALTSANPAPASTPAATSPTSTASPTSKDNNTSNNGPRKLIKKRNNNNNASTASASAAATSSFPMPDSHLRSHSHQSSHPTSPNFGPTSYTTASAKRKPTPDIPASLPQTLFFDRLRLSEVTAAHRLEVRGYPEEDAASLEKLRYRQAAAPHLFLGAFLPGSPNPKPGKGDGGASGGGSKDSAAGSGAAGGNHAGAGGSSGSGSAEPPRTLVGFITGTAALALTLRSMSTHSNSKDARLVCIHSVVVAREYQRNGLALRMLREYIGRLMRNELGPHDARLAALAEAKAAAAAAAAAAQGSSEDQAVAASTKAPVAFADDDLIGDEDDEAEVENEKSGDRQRRKRGYQALALLAHQEIVPLYLKAGFRVQGLSHVNYGSGDWYEMRREIVPKNFLSKHESSDEAEEDDDDDDDGGEKLAATKPSSGWLEPLRSPVPASRSASQGSHDSTTPKAEVLSPSGADSKNNNNLKVVGAENGGNSSDEGASGGMSASPPGLALPPTLNTNALLAALTSSSARPPNNADNDKLQSPTNASASGGANVLGSSPAGSGILSPPRGRRNPGIPFSTVLGQALAGKTASEDPRSTLEARLVNRDEETNIADLYCPREQCDCLLLRADLGVWKARELGPLCAPALQSTSEILPPNTPAPPLNGVAPPPPRPSEDQHTSPLLFAANQKGGALQQQQQQERAAPSSTKVSMQGATSLRDFWSVPGPFVFDNVSFSKDVLWPPAKPPQPTRKGSALANPAQGRGRSNSGSLLSSPPGVNIIGTNTPPASSAVGEAEKKLGASKLSTSTTSSSTPSSPRVKEGGTLSPRERSQSGSALNTLGDPVKSPLSAGSDGTALTPGEELQRALFASGVEANMTGGLKYPVSSGTAQVLGANGGASASTPLLIPPKDKGAGSKMGLKVTIGKRKTSLAVPTLSTVASQPDDGAPSSAPGTATGNSLLSPGANTPQVASPGPSGPHGWASSAASAGKKGLAAALGRGGKNKDKDKDRDGDTSAAASPAIGSSSTFGGAGDSSSTLVGSTNAAPGQSGAGAGGSTPAKPIRKASGIDPHAYPFNTSSAFTSGSWHLPGNGSPSAAAAASEPESPTLPSLTIKYLLCPECDCGPLGYVVISDEMKGGGLARSVAASQGGRDEGGKAEGAGDAAKKKMEYLLAADRVRYRFKAS
ncbi:hypothetical protein OC846_000132 [Tilletia horrida]|uniref:N-acetyltransferase domain-containing protein n=1 Tax=Tilletia horrida TaxID=155126 RepID=A0AAN6JUW7_9BASI|nr:hypothetical protein OC845_000500 [Tilletia horrida]KAK0557838.1 hypothetical protein OC846_000132 [Tilletia horrida]